MKRISLKAFVEDRSQEESARLLGCTQGAISKAIRAERDIYVIIHDDGTFMAEELRSFPSGAAKKSAA